ncbi:xylitol dehydrogenase [Atractiella rhizophila]|nr:xylitol dehydrogenase [Atractiella rhizophila]
MNILTHQKDGCRIIVSPRKTGICGSDVHYLKHGKIADFIVKDPMVLGHETAGIVVAVGPKVTHLKKGDRVALEPGETCRTCYDCKAGRYELCPSIEFAATPPFDGTLQGFYKLPGDLAYKLPDNVSLEEGAMIEPLSVAVQSVARIGGMKAGLNVAIFGAGPVGLLAQAVAKALGARRIIAVDIQERRLAFANKYVGSETFIPPKPEEGEQRIAYSRRVAGIMKEKFKVADRGLEGIDLAVDCTGAEACIQTALYLVKDGGTYVQVGMGNEFVQVPITAILTKEVTIKGSFRYGPGVYEQAIDLVARGLVDLKPLITHRYKFKDAIRAFKTTQDAKGEDGEDAIKTIIDGYDDD